MKRWMMKRLIAWKNDAHRKPLILDVPDRPVKAGWLKSSDALSLNRWRMSHWRTMRLWINFFPVLYVLNG